MKKNLAFILFIAVFVLSGCGASKLQSAADRLAEMIPERISESLDLSAELEGVQITWRSGNTAVLSHDGKVHRQEEDKGVKLNATLQYQGRELEVSFIVTVLGTKEDPWEENPGGDPGWNPGENPGGENPGGNPGGGSGGDPSARPDHYDYYKGYEGLTGESLKKFLHDLIDDHKKVSYDSAKQHLLITDQDPENPNNFILFYSGRSIPKTTPIGGVWDREHVWAKSHGQFTNNSIPGSDLHHLRPSDRTANNTRGNLDFDIGGRPLTSVVYAANSSYNRIVDGVSFEPRDEEKGDVARMLFYMAVRYDGSDGPDLELNDKVNNGKTRYMGRISVLLIWNRQDPVDDFERNRNDVIFGIQQNRNPFIDFPEFAEMIWGN